jgi:hypothetical protein
MMRLWVQKWLGIDAAISHAYDASMTADSINRELQRLRTDIRVQSCALGRIIAKVDPMYGKPEIDPERKRESDEIGVQVLRKLEAELEASSKFNP